MIILYILINLSIKQKPCLMLLMIFILIIVIFISRLDVLVFFIILAPLVLLEIVNQTWVEIFVKILEVKGISVSFRVSFHPIHLLLEVI